MDIDSFWEYTDPAISEQHFRAALETARGDDRLELLTQIARTFSLRARFDEAHEILNEVERHMREAGPRPRVRYLLERGRTYNSNGDKETARALFVEAWERAQVANEEGLAVDAAHMVAIAHSGTLGALEWNQRGLALARHSEDRKAVSLIPAMLNNVAWDLHEMRRFDEALTWFEEAQAEWTVRGKLSQTRIAKWSVARCLRSLGRHDEALAIQTALAAEHAASGSADGYVFEEIAENLAAEGRVNEARPYFRKAADVLSSDAGFVESEPERLASLRARAGLCHED